MKRELSSRVDQSLLRRFGRVEKMNILKVLMVEVSGRRVRGAEGFGWMDGVMVTMGCIKLLESVRRIEGLESL